MNHGKRQAVAVGAGPPVRVTIYTKPGCHLCEVAKIIIDSCRPSLAFELTEVDVSRDTQLLEKYGQDIPVIWLNGREIARHFIRRDQLLSAVRAAGQKTGRGHDGHGKTRSVEKPD